jgi:hypothetical protein
VKEIRPAILTVLVCGAFLGLSSYLTNASQTPFHLSTANLPLNSVVDAEHFLLLVDPVNQVRNGYTSHPRVGVSGGMEASTVISRGNVAIDLSASPQIVGTVGYINTNPLTLHTTESFSTNGASTLVAFVSSHQLWDGKPVSITGISDNLNNTWKLLTGPTEWVGEAWPLVSAIYYINSPVTSGVHTVTLALTNAAPAVVHVFAVSATDITSEPITSAITNPRSSTATVTTGAISVPANTLLLAWVKNETQSDCNTSDGFSLDANSVGFLWAESQQETTAGSYRGHFVYNAANGFQTAVVGLKPALAPDFASDHAQWPISRLRLALFSRWQNDEH